MNTSASNAHPNFSTECSVFYQLSLPYASQLLHLFPLFSSLFAPSRYKDQKNHENCFWRVIHKVNKTKFLYSSCTLLVHVEGHLLAWVFCTSVLYGDRERTELLTVQFMQLSLLAARSNNKRESSLDSVHRNEDTDMKTFSC